MKKCLRCKIVFHSDFRAHCLYCGCGLVQSGFEEIASQTSLKEKIFKDDNEGTISHEHMQYLVGSYFKKQSFPFLYMFSRNQMKIGPVYERLLIQPFNLSFIIKLPWVFINIFDSIFFRWLYKGYCNKCGWKYKKILQESWHSQDECDYNKEYSITLDGVLNGRIIKIEERYEQVAREKIKEGKRSAYHDLCAGKRSHEMVIDIITILISMNLIIYLLVIATFPFFARVYQF